MDTKFNTSPGSRTNDDQSPRPHGHLAQFAGTAVIWCDSSPSWKLMIDDVINDGKWWYMMIDQSVGLKFGTFEIMYKYSYPQPSWVLLFQPMVGAAIHRSLPSCFFRSTVSTPPVDPPTQWQAQDRYTKCSWASKMISRQHPDPPKKWWVLTLEKNGKAFFGVKLKNWPMAAKELQPPATNLPRFITKHWGIQKLCHWNLCCQQHDHMTTRPHDHKKEPKRGPNQAKTY